jgi:hypothetical protein
MDAIPFLDTLKGKVGWLFSSMIAVFRVASFIFTIRPMHRKLVVVTLGKNIVNLGVKLVKPTPWGILLQD